MLNTSPFHKTNPCIINSNIHHVIVILCSLFTPRNKILVNRMNLLIRKASTNDLDGFLELYYGFYRELRSRQGWSPRSIDEYREEAENILGRDTVFIAYVNDLPAGFIRVSERDGSYWIEELYVKPMYRVKGIGRKLVEAAEEFVKKHDPAVYIMVLPQDRRALEFWLHMGYNILNTVELVKDLEPTRGGESRVFEIFGYKVDIWRWRREDYDEYEKQYLEALEEFYKHGGTRREFLEIVSRALKDWLKKRRHQFNRDTATGNIETN